jgi:hypothetical protein
VRVVVSVEAGSQHLEISGGGQVTKVIPPHRQVPVDLRATAKTSGVFTLVVSLNTPTAPSRRYGQPVELLVRSTAYGAEALLITVGATAVLFIGAGVRLFRRAQRSRRAARSPA